MEKLYLQIFRELKQEIIEAEERREDFSDEEEEQYLARYKEIIEILSEHDLSDIDFEEWRGMFLFADEDNPLDFSKTKANIDFSILGEYDAYKTFPNFKSCQIKNFDFGEYYYSPEMFDEEFRRENEGRFLSKNISEDVAERFYKGELTLTDIQNNPELTNKIEEKNLDYGLRDIYKIIGREEFCKLDAQFIDKTRYYIWTELLNSNPNLRTAEEIMPALYKSAREQIIGLNRRFYWSQNELGDRFKEENPDLFLSEEVPESVREHYYGRNLSMREFSENLKHFKEKTVAHSFGNNYEDEKMISLYGDGIYQLFADYKPLMDKVICDYTAMSSIKVPGESITEEQRKEIMSSVVLTYIKMNGFKNIQNWNEIKMILDFIPIEQLPLTPNTREFIEKYGIDTLLESGLEMKYLFKGSKLSNLEKISSLTGQEEFLKICADYGKCLGEIDLSTKDEITPENIKETIEQAIYKCIKEKGIEYSEGLPLSFQEKHPELFLSKEIDEELRSKFYAGKLSFEDVRQNPQIKQLLLTKDISVGFGRTKYGQPMLGGNNQRYVNPMWEKLTEQEIMDLAQEYGKYLKDVNPDIFIEGQSIDEREQAIQKNIEENILSRRSYYDESIPEFFKQIHPDMFLDEKAPEELKKAFYDNKANTISYFNISKDVDISFQLIKKHPEWREFLQGKDLSRAFSRKYRELFKRFDSSTLVKLGTRNPETIEKMVQNHREDLLENWYKSTGGKFVPHHVVMLNFPEGEIDSFLGNSKRWSQLMRIDNYNINDDGKTAILKASYAMGVFQGDDDGFNKTMKLFTDVPQELTQEEYEKVSSMFNSGLRIWNGSNIFDSNQDEKMRNLFEQAYTLSDNGKYVFSMDKQKNKDSVKIVREILEKAQIPRILTPEKAHLIFDSFAMEYNPDFVRFFNDNIEEILSNPEHTIYIATIQRQFKNIVRTNAGRRLTLDVAEDYIKSILYTDIEVGNEGVAEQAKIAGYSQKDFEAIQSLFNEGEVRDFSSIPRIQGSTKGYTYEMLRCDDPLALTIGILTDCCQQINGAGETSMKHSVISPDGRVFCVRDAQGRLVAQSWFWRNQYTGCFDNIEIPHRIFELYEKEHPDVGRKGLTTDVLEVYKKAAQDLMQEDARVYQELLENGTITQEQYDALLLGKVTIGLGYNDIADAIQSDKTIHQETDIVRVKGTDRLPDPYTDASIQYTIAEREGTIKSEHENLYVHQDDVPVFDGTNMSSTVLLTMKRMEQATGRNNLANSSERSDDDNLPKSQSIINSIARGYGLDPNDTRVMATARIALIYSKDKDNKVKIGDLLSSPLKQGLAQEQKQKATAHIIHQVKKALKQIWVQDSEVDLSSLSEEQRQMLQSVIQEIEKENDERGER